MLQEINSPKLLDQLDRCKFKKKKKKMLFQKYLYIYLTVPKPYHHPILQYTSPNYISGLDLHKIDKIGAN